LVPNTGKPIPIEGSTAEIIARQFQDLPKEYLEKLPVTDTVYEAQKSEGSESGLHGRMPVAEMFIVDREIERLILNKPSEDVLYEYARKQGMLTMKDDAILKCMKGLIPWDEVNTL
jgi:type II secretory ATPase GspE/PulE/Tfp pilus assembly ATPase PilB-like protein